MQTDYKQIKKHFEKSMNLYDKNAVVQDFTAQKLACEISKISAHFDDVLEIGAGTGILTKYLLKTIRFNNYCANDLVEKSQSYLRKILPDVKFICGDALEINVSEKFDLIASNAVLQWFPDFDALVRVLKQNLKSGGILAFTTFLPENFKEIKNLTGISLHYKTSDELIEILKEDFEILYCESFVKVLKFNSALEVLAHMKNTGVNSVCQKNWTIKTVKEFCEKYSEIYPENTLTYAPLIIIAKKRA